MQKYTAIILASREANEVNRLYAMYTLEQGLLKAAAKGVRKPEAKLAGHLEPGTLSEVYVARSRGMGQITGAITLENFDRVKKDFGKLNEFLKVSGFFLKNFSEGERDERIFGLLRGFLEIADDAERAEATDIVAEAFWWKLFDFLGHRPQIMRCVNCGAKLAANSKKYFSAEKGGAVCAGCGSGFKETLPVSDNQIKLLRVFWGNPLEKVVKVRASGAELKGLERIGENFKKYNF